MSDETKITINCRAAQAAGHEIDDATARVIASLYHSGQASLGYSFGSTGAIPEDTSRLWRELFPFYRGLSQDERLWADMLGTYLLHHGERGPVDGWSLLWV